MSEESEGEPRQAELVPPGQQPLHPAGKPQEGEAGLQESMFAEEAGGVVVAQADLPDPIKLRGHQRNQAQELHVATE